MYATYEYVCVYVYMYIRICTCIFVGLFNVDVCVYVYIRICVQGSEDLSCRSFFTKEPLIIGLFCGK